MPNKKPGSNFLGKNRGIWDGGAQILSPWPHFGSAQLAQLPPVSKTDRGGGVGSAWPAAKAPRLRGPLVGWDGEGGRLK